jgi:adenylate cyclase
MTWSFRSALLARISIVLLIALTVAGLYTFWQVNRTANELGDRIIRQTSSQILQRVDALLADTESQARITAGLIRPTFAESKAGSFNSRQFPDLSTKIIEVLKAKPHFAAITIILDQTGEEIQIAQNSGSAMSIRTIEATAVGMVRKSYVPFGNQLAPTDQEVGIFPDPRLRSSYTLAKATKLVSWTTSDVLQGLPSGRVLGTNCSAPILTSEGEFLGVVTIAISLEDLSRFLQTVQVSKSGFASLFEVGGERSKLIADPQPQRLMIDSMQGSRLATIEELQDPLLAQIAQRVEALPVFDSTQVRYGRTKIGNETYLVGFRRIQGQTRPPWILAVTLPQADFLSGSREVTVFFLTFSALALAAGAGIALLLANRVAQPLQNLAEETQKMKRFELGPHTPKVIGIREIDELAAGFETLKSGLRSMEKLVPADYARSLIASGTEAKLGGERRHITTYFGDLLGFTRLSHELPPEDLVEILAEYLDVLSNVVLQSGGTVDKFNGDDVMAFWGAPTITTDHATNAVRSALKSIAAVSDLHVELRKNNLPTLSASFGIATGDVIVGNVGSKNRMTYTVIGDSVNLASRLQGLNKFYLTHILASHRTFLEAEEEFVWRLVDSVSVLGRFEPDYVYEPLDFRASNDSDLIKLAELSNDAFALYQNREFEKAAHAYEEILIAYPKDGPSSVLHHRCLKYLKTPPQPDWDGSFEMSLK